MKLSEAMILAVMDAITVPLKINLTGNAERNALHMRSISVLLSVLYTFYTRSESVPALFSCGSIGRVPCNAFTRKRTHSFERVHKNR